MADQTQRLAKTHIGQGGQVNLAGKPGLPGQFDQRQILNDQGVGMHMAVQIIHEPSGRVQFIRLDQRVQRYINPCAFGMCQIRQSGEFFQRKVLGFHARGKLL